MPKYQVEKSISIAADPMKVYETLADYSTWTTWSPWLISEPTAKVTVSSDPSSVGSIYAWKGDMNGEGELEHKLLVPGEQVEDELRFIKPFKAICKTAFHMSRVPNGTQLTWSLDASLPWFLFWMIPFMKTFIGMDYQRGLTMLKDLIETGSIPSQTIVHGKEPITKFQMAGIAGSCSVDAIGPSMDASFREAEKEMRKANLPTDRGMISVYTKFRVKAGSFDYLSGYILPEGAEVPEHSPLKSWSIGNGNAFRVEHVGPSRHLGNAWSAANQICRYKKLRQKKIGTYEIYRSTSPDNENESRTDIYLPLRD